jgi:DNA-binding MarR family transcriptional regulator
MNTNQIFALISKVRRDSSNLVERTMHELGMEGLLPSHGAILGALFHNSGKLRMKEIADITNRDKSTITYLVNLLSQFGYVTREKSDKDSRETYIVLTDKAWGMKDKFQLVSEKLMATAYIGFTEDERYKLFELLKKLDENFKE